MTEEGASTTRLKMSNLLSSLNLHSDAFKTTVNSIDYHVIIMMTTTIVIKTSVKQRDERRTYGDDSHTGGFDDDEKYDSNT